MGSAPVWMSLAMFLLWAVFTTAGWVTARRRLAVSLRDRDDLANSSQLLEEERRMLELVAKGAALGEVLDTLNLAIERISPGALCTVMLLDEDQRRFLSLASGPSLPVEYTNALERLEIGPDVGACGTAAFLNQTVVVEDVATDPKFAVARDFVLGHGLRSCWSQPVRDSGGSVLGTFAIYHGYVARPRPEELRMARVAAQLAGNAIERIRAQKALSEASKRLGIAERVARFGIWEADYRKGLVTISRQMAAMLERPAEETCLSLEEFEAPVHPEDLPSLRATRAQAQTLEGTVQREYRLVLPGSTVRWVRGHWRYELSEGVPVRAIGAVIDVTEERKLLAEFQEAAQAARKAEKLEQDRKSILEMVAKDQPLDQIAETMARAIASHQPDSMCAIRVEMAGAPAISVCSRRTDRLTRVLDRIGIASVCQSSRPEPVTNLSTFIDWQEFIENGEDFPFRSYQAVPIYRNSRLTGLIMSFAACERAAGQAEEHLLESWGQFASLAVERSGLYEQLSFRAQYDSLTTLLNRASLYERVDALIRRTDGDGAGMGVVYVDLDCFKEVNDQHGHGAGDKVLQEVSRRILQCVRRSDFAARIGGDEFVVILPGVSDAGEAGRVADLLVSAIEEPILFSGRELHVGASCGISIFPDNGRHTDALLKKADEEMYRTKLRRQSRRSRQHREVDRDLIVPEFG